MYPNFNVYFSNGNLPVHKFGAASEAVEEGSTEMGGGNRLYYYDQHSCDFSSHVEVSLTSVGCIKNLEHTLPIILLWNI